MSREFNYEEKNHLVDGFHFSTRKVVVMGILITSFNSLVLTLMFLSSSSGNVLILKSLDSSARNLEISLCESAINSIKDGSCAWGVMNDDTCYEAEHSDGYINSISRFKILNTSMVGDKCKVIAKDYKENSILILRAFVLDLREDRDKYPWHFQVSNIQEIFITEKEKRLYEL